MSSIMTSSVRKTGLDHFEPDISTDPHAQRKLRGQLEKIDFTAFAANREMISATVGSIDIKRFQRLALAAADARARWVAEALAISADGRAGSPEQIARLTQYRTAYDELSEAYEALRRMVDRGYLPVTGTE
jgi:hypothetical protein